METKNEKIEYLNIKEATKYLKISRDTLYTEVRRGAILCDKTERGLVFKKTSLDQWLRNKQLLTNEKPILSLPVMLIDNEKIVDALINIKTKRK